MGFYQDGGPVRAIAKRSGALEKWLNSMVYGRYNELVFMGFINQQTSLEGHHPLTMGFYP